MGKLGVKTALKILKQVENGDWLACGHFDYKDYLPYKIVKGDLKLWVANGLWFYEIEDLANFTLAAKFVLHFGGLNRFVKDLQSAEKRRAKAYRQQESNIKLRDAGFMSLCKPILVRRKYMCATCRRYKSCTERGSLPWLKIILIGVIFAAVLEVFLW